MTADLVIRGVLTVVLLLGLGAVVWLLSFNAIPEENQEIVWSLTGALGALTTMSVQWWFGSSKGSSDKTQLIREIK